MMGDDGCPEFGGVQGDAFSHYENGKTKPPLELVKLLKVLGLDSGLLLEVRAARSGRRFG
jgi:HTH-type transcriptional regulator/antitoxin MqsA